MAAYTPRIEPKPGRLKTAAMLSTPFVMAAVGAAMLVYGWCTP